MSDTITKAYLWLSRKRRRDRAADNRSRPKREAIEGIIECMFDIMNIKYTKRRRESQPQKEG